MKLNVFFDYLNIVLLFVWAHLIHTPKYNILDLNFNGSKVLLITIPLLFIFSFTQFLHKKNREKLRMFLYLFVIFVSVMSFLLKVI